MVWVNEMAKDAKGRTKPGYSRHVFICGHQRPEGSPRGCCAEKNSLEVVQRLKQIARQAGLDNVRVQKSGCLDFCENGISCVVYPEGIWYSLNGSEEQLIRLTEQHLRDGVPVEEMQMKIEP
jgi:(2Fe-2S) ferredoxin|tara:strand:+ start:752 stop:1117 length:366 start_codon:yes stop_codon:yes gene_type:complete